jgi:hypothetical protein
LKIENEIKGKVKQNQSVIVSKINGDWLWVNSVDGSDKLQGYITKNSVLAQPAKSQSATTQQLSHDAIQGYQDYSSGHRQGHLSRDNDLNQHPHRRMLQNLIFGSPFQGQSGGNDRQSGHRLGLFH